MNDMNDWRVAFELHEDDDGTMLVVRGEIDLSVATRFAQELERVLQRATVPVTVDLAAVGFIDSAGVRELVMAQRRARDDGVDLVLRDPSDACRRVLELSGLLAEFTIVEAA